jgi:hypothetical protein
MYQSQGASTKFKSLPRNISRFEAIERSLEDASKLWIVNRIREKIIRNGR